MTMLDMECECCKRSDRKAVGVASSGLGAISLAFCKECLENGAEPEFMFEYIFDMVGLAVRPDVLEMTTFKDGKYITYKDWVASRRFYCLGCDMRAPSAEAFVHREGCLGHEVQDSEAKL